MYELHYCNIAIAIAKDDKFKASMPVININYIINECKKSQFESTIHGRDRGQRDGESGRKENSLNASKLQ